MQTSIKTRISDELKVNATHVLSDCGLTVSAAIRLFLEQVVHDQGIPFKIQRKPSAKMTTALNEAADIEASANHRYQSIDGMFTGLDSGEK